MHHKKRNTIFYTILFLALTFCILTSSRLSLSYASLGLTLWFEKMIPALLPFMILSGIMIRMNLTEGFTAMVYPAFRTIFKVSENVCYCIIIGFLCGFPMGAKTVSEMYLRKKITGPEAEFLLCFVNNIGPIYFTGFVLPLLNRKLVLPYVVAMYGIPLLYGVILRFTLYRRTIPFLQSAQHSDRPVFFNRKSQRFPRHCPRANAAVCNRTHVASIANSNPFSGPAISPFSDSTAENAIFPAIDSAIQSSVSSILALGGYMILFNVLNLLPHILFRRTPVYLAPFLEISGGLSLIGDQNPLFVLLILPFGGASCIAQTYNSIKDTDLKIGLYTIHKVLLTLVTMGYYLLWKIISPETFLK